MTDQPGHPDPVIRTARIVITMELYTIQAKGFKEIYYRNISIAVLAVVASFLLVSIPYGGTIGLDPKRLWSMPVLLILVVISVVYSYYHKREMEKVYDCVEFDEQVKVYERIYTVKLYFHLFSCLVVALMYVLTLRPNYFYFSLIELFILLTMYPGRGLFRRALRNDEVVVC